MKKVTLFDKRYFFITDDKEAALKEACGGTGMIDIDSADGKNYFFHPRAVMMIEKGMGPEIADLIPKERRVEAPKGAPATKDSPGYKAYLKAKEKLLRKKGIK